MHKLFFLILLVFTALAHKISAQSTFPEKALGTWEGQMLLYKDVAVYDSTAMRLLIEKTGEKEVYTWNTEYLSKKYPVTKDYQLRLLDAEKQTYALDEGDGIVLKSYVFGDKMYSNFTTHGKFLASSYELRGGELIFEVNSGKQLDETEGVTNYSVNSLQRAVMQRVK